MKEKIRLLQARLESTLDKREEVEILFSLADIFLKQNQADDALFYLTEAQVIIEKLEEKLLLSKGYHLFSRTYKQLGDFEKALEYYEKFHVETEKATGEVEETLSALKKAIEAVKVGLTITDTEGRIIYTNSAEASMHGYRVEEVIGKHARIFSMPEMQRKSSIEDLKKMNNWKRESLNVRKDRSIFPVQLVSNAIIDAFGKPIGLVTICEDITERKQAEEKIRQTHSELEDALVHLEELNREKNEILSIVAHDLKNPLSAIRATAQMIAQFSDIMFKDDIIESACNIENGANRMFELIKNLLDLDAMELGKRSFNYKEFDLRLSLLTVINDYIQQTEDKKIQINCTPLEEEYNVFADESAANQILDNLISNAVKYSPHGKNINVRVKRNDQYMRCEVQDQGPGIGKEDQKKLFGKFVRLGAKATGDEHSTGLGLSIVKNLTEAMNGKVWCESEFGKGATFIVELPTKSEIE